jgi:hypothetical protein
MWLLAMYFDLGSSIATSTLDIAGTVFSDFSGYIGLMIGVIIVLAFITRLISAFR